MLLVFTPQCLFTTPFNVTGFGDEFLRRPGMVGDDIVQVSSVAAVTSGNLRHRAVAARLVQIFGAGQCCTVGGDLALLYQRATVPQVMRLLLGLQALFSNSSAEWVVTVTVTSSVR